MAPFIVRLITSPNINRLLKLTDMKMQNMFQVAEYIGLYLVDFGLSPLTYN